MATIAPETIVRSARIDERPRWRRMVAPVAATMGATLAAGTVYLIDPNVPGHYPGCPTRAVFGVDCPACGALRGTHDLLHGNVAGAADRNLLLVVAIPVVAWLAVRWYARSWSGSTPAQTFAQLRRDNRILLWSLVGALVFGVVRNFVPYLSSGA